MNVASPYIALNPTAKNRVITGAALLWFYNLFFAFSMPVVLPYIMGYYNMMKYYAILGGITSFVNCVITPIGGKLGDLFGRRKVCLVAGYSRLALLLLCAVPTNGITFILLYSFASLVGGLLNAFPSAILGDITNIEERPKWFGVFGTINGAALLLGLLGGGMIVDLLGPHSIFIIVAPFCILALVLISLYYPNRTSEHSVSIDYVGILFLSLGIGCVIAWCSFVDMVFSRGSLIGISIIAIGIFFIFILFFFERRAKNPVLNLGMFRSSNFSISFFTHLLIAPMMCLCSSSLALLGQESLGLSATMSGTLAMPKNLLLLVLPSFLGTWIAKDRTRFRSAFLLCGISITIASLLAIGWNTNTSVFTIYGVMIIFGIGTSCQSVCIQPYMQMTVKPEDIGSATAMIQFANSVGVVLFNAFHTIFYNNFYTATSQNGSAEDLALAVSKTFSCVSWLSAASGIAIVILTLRLVNVRTDR